VLDTRFVVYMDGEGRDALTPVFKLDGERATGESYTIAHHVFTEDGDRKMMVAWLRYLDVFAKIDWSETRSLGAPTAG
jgi:SnoaL-like domain